MSDTFNIKKRSSYKEQVARSISWGHYFIFINMLFACFLGFGYVYAAPPTLSLLSFFYLIVTWLGHMSFLMVVSYLVIFFPLAFIGHFKAYRVIAVIVAIILHTCLLVDIKIYLLVKIHLSLAALNLILRELDFDTGLNYNFLFIAIPLVIVVETIFAKVTTHSLYKAHHTYAVRTILALLGACFICSHVLHIWADATKYDRITLLRTTFPIHYPMTARSFLSNHGWLSEYQLSKEQANEGDFVKYPLQKIESTGEPAKNVIIISFNGLSEVNLNPQLTPNLLKLKQSAQSFEQNYLLYPNELDNVFSMNYGIPLQYRSAMHNAQILPITQEEMFRQDFVSRIIVSDVGLPYESAAKEVKQQLIEDAVNSDNHNKKLSSKTLATLIEQKRAQMEQEAKEYQERMHNYHVSLALSSGLRLAQLNTVDSDTSAFARALSYIMASQNDVKRPFAINLVLNDLRNYYTISQVRSINIKKAVAESKTDAPVSIAHAERQEASEARQQIAQSLASEKREGKIIKQEAKEAIAELNADEQAMEENAAKADANAKVEGKGKAEDQDKALAKSNDANAHAKPDAITAQAQDSDKSTTDTTVATAASDKEGEASPKLGADGKPILLAKHSSPSNDFNDALNDNRPYVHPISAEDELIASVDPLVKATLLYEDTLKVSDAALGAFINELKALGVLKNTVVIITSTEGNRLLSTAPKIFDRMVQKVPLIILWPDGSNQGNAVNSISSLQDIPATVAAEALNITTVSGNFTLGTNLKHINDRDFLISDRQNELVLVGKRDTTIYDQEGSSYIERDGKKLPTSPNLENLIQSSRDLNRFLR